MGYRDAINSWHSQRVSPRGYKAAAKGHTIRAYSQCQRDRMAGAVAMLIAIFSTRRPKRTESGLGGQDAIPLSYLEYGGQGRS
jgi:hypothetical protein